MTLDLSLLIPGIAIAIYGVLLTIVSFSRQLPHIRRGLQIFLIVLLFWSVADFLTHTLSNNIQYWAGFSFICQITSFLALFHLIQLIISNRHRWAAYIYLYGLGVVIFTTTTDLVVNFVQTRLQSSLLQFNLMIFLITLPGYALLIFSLIEMLRNYQLANDPIQRNRYRYVMASTGIFLTGMLLSHSPLGKYPVEIFGSILSALLMTYSTLKNNLADIDVVIRRSILYTIPTTVIGAGYFLIITLTLKLFNAMSGLQLLMISMIVAIPSAILSQPLQEKIQSWIDRAFFKDKHESGLMLQRISGTATTFLEVNMLANMILDEISATMHIQQAAFLLKDKASKEFRLIVHRNLGKNTNIRLRADHPIVLRLSISDKVISKRDTDLLPQFKSLWDDERTVLDQIGAELYIPLRSQGELIGILAVGNRYSDRPYTKDDQATLTTLGNQVAVAIENARLYTTEQNRRKELDSLYTLSRKLIATDAMQSVTENIVEHALESVHTTFARLLLRNEDGSYICKAVHPVFGLHFDLRAGKLESIQVARYYDRAIQSGKPLVLDRHLLTLTFEERKSLFLEQVQSLCICPLRIGEEPLGVLVMGERRNPNRESFDADKLRLASAISDQASSAIWRARLHDQLEESFVQTILALANTIDAKDMYTSDHSERLATLATITARKLNCSPQDIQAINWAMHLHDIGKIGVPDEILQKPGPLNDAEWQIMRLHPEIGAKIIAPIKNLQNVVPLILHHHERFDGTGYPGSLQGENIPLGARILTVVDTYGAITDNRVYRKARSHEEAMQEIERCAGTQFDPKITAVFKEVIEDLHIKNSIPKQRNLSAVRIHDTVFPGGRGE